MSQGRAGRRNRKHHDKADKDKVNLGDKGKEVVEDINENSRVVQQFRAYAAELDDKHDRYERIFKLNRDVGIESKRIIFLLHTIDKESKRNAVLDTAKARLENLAQKLFRNIATELDGQDAYQFHRAYRAGLEEYVEALTFHEYLQNGGMQNWTSLERALMYRTTPSPTDSPEQSTAREMRVMVTPTDYILGIADLTGELMRKCINNLAIGDVSSCYQTCDFVRKIYIAFLGYTSVVHSNEVNKKIVTLKHSLTKMENACYTIKVRGSEIPKHMLADVAIAAAEKYATEDDEGYQAF
ncbi:PREDICTED: translin-associated protein X isoform X1 [Wasmannia auropunctata]|uniref:translin-associated protein X isoform X1 n=1 Tax=Wasmannia auropunctata TaxID=64793 RepID=UPI0005F061BE|nr:PREDICTED: translin-associated protein X isoform X1 [Wasmannia auropunctata]